MTPASPPPLAALEKSLGHQFADPKLVEEALTHASATEGEGPDYRRLEFLGDRVLGLVMAERIYRRHPGSAVGELHRRLEAQVRREACADAARSLGLGSHLRLSRGARRTGGGDRDSTLADTMEAVIAAVYLDAGLDAARKVVIRIWQEDAVETPTASAKSLLQEWAQKNGLGLPKYELAPREGGGFFVRARVDEELAAQGVGESRREAEQAAAQALLERLADDR